MLYMYKQIHKYILTLKLITFIISRYWSSIMGKSQQS